MRYVLNELGLEITRRCNMHCAHCMRGDAQSMDMRHSYIDKVLENIDRIGVLTFTGGEPSLNISGMEYVLQRCKELNVQVDNFYIITNGKANVVELSELAFEWYDYCTKNDVSGVALSKDNFHEPISEENEHILRDLPFFKEDKIVDFTKGHTLLDAGRAKNITDNKFNKMTIDDCEDIFETNYGTVYYFPGGYVTEIDSLIYITAKGSVNSYCDDEYDGVRFCRGSLDDGNFEQALNIHPNAYACA